VLIPFYLSASNQSDNLALDITGTSINELMNLKITSLSKKKQSLETAAAAVYVLSHDEIKRLGVTNIADALRYVPGVEVARIDASRWSITIRGFNGRAANKLLVMIDGRSVYSPLFSGVLWEEKDVLLSDVERIEVIRGPGGAVWGANAVNGVINIITKTTKETLGSMLDIGIGVEQEQLVQARYGWNINNQTAMRVYAKHRQHASTNQVLSNDDNQQQQIGFRLEHITNERNAFTLQGDVYTGEIGDLITDEAPAGQQHSGGNILFDWRFSSTDNTQHKFQGYFDKTRLKLIGIDDSREIINLDYQFEHQLSHQVIVAGVGYRTLNDKINTSPLNYLTPEKKHDQVTSAFFQDDLSFANNKWHFIFGTKFEHNDYSGDEWQPNLRLSYQPDESLLWGSWSKAVRVPTRFEKDIIFNGFSGERLESERANVYELGWRKQWPNSWLIDASIYRAEYENLLSIEADGYGNQISGKVQGLELSSSIQMSDNWLLRANYSHADMTLSADTMSNSSDSARITQGQLPQNMAQLISLWDINSSWQFSTLVRYVDQIESNDIDHYWVVDFTSSWQVSKRLSITLAARNIGDGEHTEWSELAPVPPDLTLNFKWVW
jgi:iron complex outermembrane receptor protein